MKEVIIDVKVEGANKAKKEIDNLSDSVEGLNENLEETNKESKNIGDNLDKSGKKGEKGLGGISKGFKGIGTAIKAAGIGLVLLAFSALKKILEEQQPVLDFVDTAFTAIGLAVSAVSNALSSAFESTSEATGGFDAMKTVVGNLLTIAITPMKLAFQAIKAAVIGAQLAWEQSFFGDKDQAKITELKASLQEIKDDVIEIGTDVIDAGKSIGENIGEAISEVVTFAEVATSELSEISATAIIEDAKRTTELKNQAAIREAINRGVFESFDRLAEQQRQIRDDDSKSIAERTEANDKLLVILEKQEEIMLANGRAVVAAASAAKNANNTVENTVALIEAQNELLAIQADIEGKRSEQLVNSIGLQKEANELSQTAIDRTAERAIAERDFTAQQIEDGLLRLQAQRENLDEERTLEEERLQLIIDSANAGTQAKIDAEQDLLDAKLDFAQREIEINTEIADNAKTNAESQKKLDETVAKARMAVAENVLGNLADLAEEGSDVAKGIAVAQTTMSTFQAAQAAYTAGLALGGPLGLVAGPIAAASAIAVGLKNIKGILSTSTSATGGGGGGSISASAPASTPPISDDALLGELPQVDGAETETVGQGAGLRQQAPIKAYVSEIEITNTQNRISNIEQMSEIG